MAEASQVKGDSEHLQSLHSTTVSLILHKYDQVIHVSP